MPIRIIKNIVVISELGEIAREQFGDFIKAVVDIKKEIMAIGGELHADEEAMLLEQGSLQKNLWGINIYVDKLGDEMIEFNSMINVRPSQKNYSRGVEDKIIQEKIISVVRKLVHK